MSFPEVSRLTYFNAMGRAEVTRQMLFMAGEKYEDVRHTFEKFRRLKCSGEIVPPFGQLPIFEVNKELTICQAHAIEFYVAKKHGFIGDSLVEETINIMVSSCVEEILNPLQGMVGLKGKDRDKAVAIYENDKMDSYLKKITTMLKKNTKSELFISDKISLADLRILSIFQFYEVFKITFDQSKYPELLKLKTRLELDEKLQEWMKKRPITDF